jgi:hypothetical protein
MNAQSLYNKEHKGTELFTTRLSNDQNILTVVHSVIIGIIIASFFVYLSSNPMMTASLCRTNEPKLHGVLFLELKEHGFVSIAPSASLIKRSL